MIKIPCWGQTLAQKTNFLTLFLSLAISQIAVAVVNCSGGGKPAIKILENFLVGLESSYAELRHFSRWDFVFMDGSSIGKIKINPDHFQSSTPSSDSNQNGSPSTSCSSVMTENCSRRLSARRRFRRAALMLNLLTRPRLPWLSATEGQEKVDLTAAELESLKSELCDLEERESLFKAQLEHVDEVLRSARLCGYLYIRTRWTALPGEAPPLDDTDVDDWLPRFVILHGPCIFFYLLSTDMSPQDSALLSDIVEVGPLPSFTREDNERLHAFYMLTRHGLRYECSGVSKIQVDSWVSALQEDCKSISNSKNT